MSTLPALVREDAPKLAHACTNHAQCRQHHEQVSRKGGAPPLACQDVQARLLVHAGLRGVQRLDAAQLQVKQGLHGRGRWAGLVGMRSAEWACERASRIPRHLNARQASPLLGSSRPGTRLEPRPEQQVDPVKVAVQRGVALARHGQRVLPVDADHEHDGQRVVQLLQGLAASQAGSGAGRAPPLLGSPTPPANSSTTGFQKAARASTRSAGLQLVDSLSTLELPQAASAGSPAPACSIADSEVSTKPRMGANRSLRVTGSKEVDAAPGWHTPAAAHLMLHHASAVAPQTAMRPEHASRSSS